MAHKVTFTVPERDLGKADIQFSIKRNGQRFGKLLVSKGTVVWLSKNKQYGKKLGWTEFDNLMSKHGHDE